MSLDIIGNQVEDDIDALLAISGLDFNEYDPDVEALVGELMDDEDDFALAGYDDDEDDYGIAGYDYDDYDDDGAASGARRRRRRPRSRRSRGKGRYMALLRKMAQMKKKSAAPAKKKRRFPLGFDSVEPIPANSSIPVTRRPQVPFRPEQLIVPRSIAANFLIHDIKVGKNSQFAAASTISAETFTEDAASSVLQQDVAQISQDIVIHVQNIAAAPQRFLATFIGTGFE